VRVKRRRLRACAENVPTRACLAVFRTTSQRRLISGGP
jgi:hypothetical protein